MPAGSFTELIISHDDSGIAVVYPALISGGHIQLLSPEYSHPVRAELGMPLDTHLVIFSIEGLPSWQGYTCALVGVQEKYKFVGGHSEPASPPEAPRFTFCVAGYDAPLTLIPWRRRVHCQGTPIFLEVLWHPETGETIALKGLEWGTPQKHVLRAYKGIKLLKAIDNIGRPLGSKSMSEAEFRQRYHKMYQQLLDAYASKPRRYEVAEALNMDAKTFREHLRDCKLPFPPF